MLDAANCYFNYLKFGLVSLIQAKFWLGWF
jgi:hypothetical protein